MTDNRAINGATQLGRYERAWLRPDVVAGLTVTAYLVPQVMAYAQLAGLDPSVAPSVLASSATFCRTRSSSDT